MTQCPGGAFHPHVTQKTQNSHCGQDPAPILTGDDWVDFNPEPPQGTEKERGPVRPHPGAESKPLSTAETHLPLISSPVPSETWTATARFPGDPSSGLLRSPERQPAREGTQQRSGRGRSRLPAEEPDVGLNPGTWGSHPELKVLPGNSGRPWAHEEGLVTAAAHVGI